MIYFIGRLDVRCRRIKDDSKLFSLSAWKNGMTINWDVEDDGKGRFGREDQEMSYQTANWRCQVGTWVLMWKALEYISHPINVCFPSPVGKTLLYKLKDF